MSVPNRVAVGTMPQIDMEKVRSERRVGIAYSGGGDRVVVELGIAKAFIELGIVPDAMAGVSAGAFAAAFHALDPRSLRYLPLAQQIAIQGVPYLHPSLFGNFFRLVPAALSYAFGGASATHLASIVDRGALERLLKKRLPVKQFSGLEVPLSIAATDLLDGAEMWFDAPEMELVPALLASSAIPALFAPVTIGSQVYVDGSTADNLPLFRLAQQGCSTIYAANVSYAGELSNPPRNLIDTAVQSISVSLYNATLLQERLLSQLYPEVRVILVRPETTLTTLPSTFNSKDVPRIIDQTAAETKQLLQAMGVAVAPASTAPSPAGDGQVH